MAGLGTIPAIIRQLDDADRELVLIENLQGRTTAVEEAQAYRQMIERYQYTQEMLAQKLAKVALYSEHLTHS